ncbi:peptide/nickel transport system ATP-binding protein [Clostridium acetobutylicum]|uniref:Oligopeptide ABC transporter, ATPase component n=1 Tax=Clostridium acetobutylicum (strain ATCC 824 / DSM 792 / JCM 1419 / IAM 19013 / LMG 5710 / NBRC 13948 / NRRL B-527 / VKM B-1787 / 2291 / W) TaxID=272562 RepID=Q97ED1_CLOAB|nr:MULTISPECIES: ABC transporter ATP-binding protein [Clostridium]AAK81119.1 Oligopeptide ABC transporter, ATPase component [Clostridium acetobutylicum ATCC 824]ADZ22223.1 Oligopeptide ABC transporter, ATPase component [Clostridium acetobutylicum EA 2018]AEI34447.1 oligopeptide ABC transporter, ATPase component [Clostridium acetobutylicum DSM 1731]AWV82095.1 ABC transporter ATP-binding protein [Clostridium acetobutylicum]AWV82144.1 ABC transporter ATP-binding protein [Clostridium acetobutylicu
MKEDLLKISNLKTYFYIDNDIRKAVDNISFSVKKGETVCIVGESGCGKSVTSLSIMGLINEPGRIINGEILYKNNDLLKLSKSDLQKLRGKEISMIFQEPMTSLNPVFTIGHQITEILLEHELINKDEAYKKAIRLINSVGLPRAEEIMKSYPHKLSGGMLQRIIIAMALSSNPKLLIADEPTTALDVTIQAQILDLLKKLKSTLNTSILFITHDLGVVAEIADYVIVMYAGKIIEEAPVIELFKNPKHPYTQGLLNSKPIIGKHRDKLYSIKGSVPDLSKLNESCYFHDRCEHCKDICTKKSPAFTVNNNHKTACWLYERRYK